MSDRKRDNPLQNMSKGKYVLMFHSKGASYVMVGGDCEYFNTREEATAFVEQHGKLSERWFILKVEEMVDVTKTLIPVFV